MVLLRSRFGWLTFVKLFYGFARVGLGQVLLLPGLVRSGLSGFEHLLEGERSGFEAVMRKVVHKPTVSLKT